MGRESDEGWYRRLLDVMTDGFCVVEVIVNAVDDVVDVRYRETNPAFSRLTGYRGLEGRLASEAVPELEQHWFDQFQHVYRTGESRFFVERVASLDRWYEVLLNRIGGKEEGRLTCLFKDVTGRKLAEDERERVSRRLHELTTALSESDRRKTEFLATLAHELRNPLAPIRNGLELLGELLDDPLEIERMRGMMTRQVDQMTRLVDDLLDVARISQGTVSLKLERVRLEDVLGAAIEGSRPLIEHEGHELRVELPRESLSLVIDPVRVTQIVTNLLNNAARYTPRGGHVRVEASFDEREVRVAVSDDGEGIDAASLELIFEMFTQVEGDQTPRHGGLGIGLTLSQRLAHLHGGTLSVQSGGTGEGSRFELRLPIVADLQDPAPARVGGVPALSDATRRVLIVDDNADAADALAKLLALRGFETSVAYDGRSAIDAVRAGSPRVLLLDLGLPDISGYQVASELGTLGLRESLTLVALTGWGAEKDRVRSDEAGFDHHLTKPISAARLLETFSTISAARGS